MKMTEADSKKQVRCSQATVGMCSLEVYRQTRKREQSLK